MLDDHDSRAATSATAETIRRGVASPVVLPAPSAGPAAPERSDAPPVRKLFQDLRWYVVQHEPFQGRKARNAIRALGFAAFWPRTVIERSRRDDLLAPLFPGYLFAQFAVARGGWGAIKALDEVVAILGLREIGAPVAMPAGYVERMIDQAGGVDLPVAELRGPAVAPRIAMQAGARFSVGEAVCIADDALADFRGLLHHDGGAARVKVLFNILGMERVVEVDRAKVRRA